MAYAATSLAELKSIMEAYDGCALKRTCQTTVFGDGSATARVMIVGEAPGADEDRIGRPFVGASGRLLDRMLAAIGLDRRGTYIANTVYWRPPGNRKPTDAEVALCLPFVRRQVELARPKVLVLSGAAAMQRLLDRTEGIGRLRGRWVDYPLADGTVVPAIATFHPAYLLRSPLQKREAWRDMLAVKRKLSEV